MIPRAFNLLPTAGALSAARSPVRHLLPDSVLLVSGVVLRREPSSRPTAPLTTSDRRLSR